MGNTNCVLFGCVEQASVGVVERWGRFEKLAQPGLHFFNPFAGECLAGILSTRISSLDVRIETKTKVSSPSSLKIFPLAVVISSYIATDFWGFV